MNNTRTIEKLLRQQAALANFGSFAFGEGDLQRILTEAARGCAESLGTPFAKICRYRTESNDLLVVAGYGWKAGVIGYVVSPANETSTQGRAFVTGQPVILEDLSKNNSFALPAFYADNGIVATADVIIRGKNGPWGVLEVDNSRSQAFDEHDINFLTGYANVVAEAVATLGRTTVLQATIDQMEILIQEKDRLLSERQALLTEKDILAEELQHRVRNNLQLVAGMLRQQIDSNDSDPKIGLRSIAQRVMSLAKIYDHLLGNGLSRTIDFDQYVRSLCKSLSAFQSEREFQVDLICEGASEPMLLDLDAVTALGIVIAEIVSNAYLHAFPGRAGVIRVTLRQNADVAVLIIGDDGIGFVEPVTRKRHGLGLVRRLMEQVGGTVAMASVQGTEWTLSFPSVSSLSAAVTQ